jgi:hypothetical protein
VEAGQNSAQVGLSVLEEERKAAKILLQDN